MMTIGTRVAVVNHRGVTAYHGIIVGVNGNKLMVDSPDTGEIHNVPKIQCVRATPTPSN